MKKDELTKFRDLLIKEREKVEEDMRRQENTSLSKSQREFAGDLSGYGFHMADAGTDTYNREFAGNMITAEQKVLFEIDEALLRMEDRNYGVCQNCRKKVSNVRLKAVPYARLCITCKKEMEGKK